MGKTVVFFNPYSPTSVWRAERIYRQKLREFDDKVDEFLAELAELGRETAQTAYGGSVAITAEPIENGYAILANGEALGFLEFGAGDAAHGNEFSDQVSYETRPGSYSETHGHQYEQLGYWIFGGVRYTEVQALEGMQTAWDTVRSQWRDIAERVFS